MAKARAADDSAPESELATLERVCANVECGESFIWEYRGRGGQFRKYCTERCRRTAKRRRHGVRAQKAPNPDAKTCRGCQATKPADEFHLQKRPDGAMRLGAKCKECLRAIDRARRPKKVDPRPCSWCGEEFTPQRNNGRYHSTACRGAAMRDRSRAIHARPPEPGGSNGAKACRSCAKTKPLSQFLGKGAGRTGPDCKSCVTNARQKALVRARLGLPPDATVRRGREPKPDGHAWRDPHGYIHEKRVGHHRADKKGYVGQHILAFEDHCGVKVPRGYTVHHKDDDRSNNHWSNLDLRVGQHGKHGNVVPTLLRHEDYFMETMETIVNDPIFLTKALTVFRDLGVITAA